MSKTTLIAAVDFKYDADFEFEVGDQVDPKAIGLLDFETAEYLKRGIVTFGEPKRSFSDVLAAMPEDEENTENTENVEDAKKEESTPPVTTPEETVSEENSSEETESTGDAEAATAEAE